MTLKIDPGVVSDLSRACTKLGDGLRELGYALAQVALDSVHEDRVRRQGAHGESLPTAQDEGVGGERPREADTDTAVSVGVLQSAEVSEFVTAPGMPTTPALDDEIPRFINHRDREPEGAIVQARTFDEILTGLDEPTVALVHEIRQDIEKGSLPDPVTIAALISFYAEPRTRLHVAMSALAEMSFVVRIIQNGPMRWLRVK